MLRHLIALCLALLLIPDTGATQSRERFGYGRLFTNDFLGDQKDRWRSGSYASSRLWGYGWDGTLPARPGDVLELRLGAELITPRHLNRPSRDDRAYAGVLSAGVHTHFSRARTEFATGVDVVVVGPQTRLDELQSAFHDWTDMPSLSQRTRDRQVPDAIHPTLVVEAGRNVILSGRARLRPFVEARAGIETYLRAGMDMVIGDMLDDELLVRAPVTGHRYRTTPGARSGLAFVLGADVAAVADSAYFPDTSRAKLRDQRSRYRAGMHWQMGRAHGFYGLTYLGEEFDTQTEGQLTGSVRIGLRF